jgi:hypothetical protein
MEKDVCYLMLTEALQYVHPFSSKLTKGVLYLSLPVTSPAAIFSVTLLPDESIQSNLIRYKFLNPNSRGI